MNRHFVPALAVLLLMASCGPNKKQLLSELSSIDHEMMETVVAMNQIESQMKEADVLTLVGSFAADYNRANGDYQRAGVGSAVASNASQRFQDLADSYGALQSRYFDLERRRVEIVAKLR